LFDFQIKTENILAAKVDFRPTLCPFLHVNLFLFRSIIWSRCLQSTRLQWKELQWECEDFKLAREWL